MTAKRSIYGMGIPRRLIDELSPRDKKTLKTMNNIIMKKYGARKIQITTSDGLHDWIQEYREEGHVL